jgi:hypothetical protein
MAKSLQERVADLERKMYAALVVAAIFGISGAFGANALNSAYEKIARLEKKAKDLEGQLPADIAAIDAEKDKDLEIVRTGAAVALSNEAGKQLSDVRSEIAENRKLFLKLNNEISASLTASSLAPPPNQFDAQLSDADHLVWGRCPSGTFVSAVASRHNNIVPKEINQKLLTGIMVECSHFTFRAN